MYTVVCDYFATGEGRTIMVLVASGNSYGALTRFADIFGSYYAIGAEVHDGVKLDFPGSEYVVPDPIRKEKFWERGMFEYHSSFHLNLS